MQSCGSSWCQHARPDSDSLRPKTSATPTVFVFDPPLDSVSPLQTQHDFLGSKESQATTDKTRPTSRAGDRPTGTGVRVVDPPLVFNVVRVVAHCWI